MKHLLTYWIIGCAWAGFVLARGERLCPDDKLPAMTELVSVAALWPEPFFAVMFGAKSHRKCDDGTSYRE